jgi:hypothetical protein
VTGIIGALVPSPVKMALTVGPYAAIGVLALLCWHFDSRAVANADTVRTQAAQFAQAQALATAAARQALQTETAAYAAKAKDADNAYQTQFAAAQTATDQYIATHRVRTTAVASSAWPAPSPSQGANPGIPATVPVNTVVVSPGDLQACTDAVTYAIQAHDWAATLGPQ